MLKVVKRLLDTGVSLQNIRKAVDHLRNRGIKDLANVTLFSDGATVYECTSAEEVVDLLAGGQGVFGIAVSGALRELSGELAELPAERIDGGPVHLGRRRAVDAPPPPRRRLTRRVLRTHRGHGAVLRRAEPLAVPVRGTLRSARRRNAARCSVGPRHAPGAVAAALVASQQWSTVLETVRRWPGHSRR